MARNSVRCLFSRYYKFSLPLLSKCIYSKNTINTNYLSYLVQIKPKKRTYHVITEVNSGQNYSTSTLEKVSNQPTGCPICSRNLTFTYKDVLLLSQFVSPEGNILNRRITGVCRKQQRKLEKAIEISRRLGLIPRKPPALLQQETKNWNAKQQELPGVTEGAFNS